MMTGTISWHDAEKEVPDKTVQVIVSYGRYGTVKSCMYYAKTTYTRGGNKINIAPHFELKNVKYWAYLPEKPDTKDLK